MFLYIDLAIITILAVVMGYTKAYEKLVAERPRSSLVSVPNVVSLLSQVLFVGSVQVGCLMYLESQKWYKPVHTEDEIFPCWENTTIFLVSCYQYIIIALIVSDGPPYRKHFFTNYLYLFSLAILTAYTTLLIFNPFEQLASAMAVVKWKPDEHFMFRVLLLMIVGCNLFLALAFEMIVARSRWLRWLVRLIKNKKEPKNEFKRIEKAISEDYEWPQTDKPIYANGSLAFGQ